MKIKITVMKSENLEKNILHTMKLKDMRQNGWLHYYGYQKDVRL